MPIVYRHRRLDTNEIFYIGIGKTEKRAYNKSNNRNKYWKNIVNKTKYSIEILFNNITWEDAKELEILLIKEYGRKDLGLGPLVNMTDGGDGSKGYKHVIKRKFSDESRLKMSISQKKVYNNIIKERLLNAHKNMSSESKYNMSKTQFKSKPVINIETNEIYSSAKELSFVINVNYATLKNWLSGRSTNKSKYIYI